MVETRKFSEQGGPHDIKLMNSSQDHENIGKNLKYRRRFDIVF
jgi:hypothetical protein